MNTALALISRHLGVPQTETHTALEAFWGRCVSLDSIPLPPVRRAAPRARSASLNKTGSYWRATDLASPIWKSSSDRRPTPDSLPRRNAETASGRQETAQSREKRNRRPDAESGRVHARRSRAPVRFKGTDVTRAVKAMRKAGVVVSRVEIAPDGRIFVFAADEAASDKIEQPNPWDDAT
jgi:hypothetical protein